MKFYFALLITFNNLSIKGAECSSNPETQETIVHGEINADTSRNSSISQGVQEKVKIFLDSLKEGIEKINSNARKDSESSISSSSNSGCPGKLFALNQKLKQVFEEKKIPFYDNEKDLSKGIEEYAYTYNSTLEQLSSKETEEVGKFMNDVKLTRDIFHFQIFWYFYAHMVFLPNFIDNLSNEKDSQEFNKFLNDYIDEIKKLYDDEVKKVVHDATVVYGLDNQKLSLLDLTEFKEHCFCLHFTFFSLFFNFYEILLEKKESRILEEVELNVIVEIINKFTKSIIDNEKFFICAKINLLDTLKNEEFNDNLIMSKLAISN